MRHSIPVRLTPIPLGYVFDSRRSLLARQAADHGLVEGARLLQRAKDASAGRSLEAVEDGDGRVEPVLPPLEHEHRHQRDHHRRVEHDAVRADRVHVGADVVARPPLPAVHLLLLRRALCRNLRDEGLAAALARLDVRLRRREAEDGFADGGPVGARDGVEEGLRRAEDAIVERGGEAGVEEDDVRRGRREVSEEEVALHASEQAELRLADENVARVEVCVDVVVPDEHLEVGLHAAQRDARAHVSRVCRARVADPILRPRLANLDHVPRALGILPPLAHLPLPRAREVRRDRLALLEGLDEHLARDEPGDRAREGDERAPKGRRKVGREALQVLGLELEVELRAKVDCELVCRLSDAQVWRVPCRKLAECAQQRHVEREALRQVRVLHLDCHHVAASAQLGEVDLADGARRDGLLVKGVE
mmetsp:Transcript_3080/g.9040  ORF Transcript_3080/g.9040 Transcript_3080/m.9040 type:complete len:421 (-) Transcript_3080:184-1446(-)